MIFMPATGSKRVPIDFAIITDLKVERDALLNRLDDGYETVQEDTEALTFYYGHITIPTTGERYTVVVVMLLGMGNDEAAVATTRVIKRWQPAHVMMVGIAGGVPGKVDLGDVAVAEACYYYELGKRTPKGEQRRPQQFTTDRLLFGRAQAYEASEWKGEIGIEPPGVEARTHACLRLTLESLPQVKRLSLTRRAYPDSSRKTPGL